MNASALPRNAQKTATAWPSERRSSRELQDPPAYRIDGDVFDRNHSLDQDAVRPVDVVEGRYAADHHEKHKYEDVPAGAIEGIEQG